MTLSDPTPSLAAGIAIIHANRLEKLRDVVDYWLRRHPLAPLENEVILVQSNGMGQWLKQGLAHNNALGIAAALDMQLPSLFVWSVYRAVLGQQIPKEQALAKAPLTWRLYRLLPALLQQPGFETLQTFLRDDESDRKRHQLAEQLADLFDQYQVYRSDWLTDWADGRDCLRDAHDQPQSLPEQQRWQAALWRAVLADVGSDAMPFASRAAVHTQFLTRIGQLTQRPPGMPRRIIVFGLSSLPQQALEVLARLGAFCQIVLFVHNPCQHYWADIIEDKELLKAERKRHPYKKTVADADLHPYAQPLLAAWGKQGRDYIRLLDHFDETGHYADWNWPNDKIDLFEDYGEPGQRSLLQQVQQTILDLEPLPAQAAKLTHVDDSLAFHIAHSPQREVEILHDQLLARFNDAERQGRPLQPRDVIVMVPDIDRYAPHIRAVFGRLAADDPRYLPFSLADQRQRGSNPLLAAVETLLNLPDARLPVSALLGLLEVPALRRRFELDETAIPLLHRWIEQAGIRWGLDAQHRSHSVDMPVELTANTWQFGLRRMLLGYAVGPGQRFAGIEPYGDIGGLEARWLGGLAWLLENLTRYADALQHPQPVDAWQPLLTQLLADFFDADDDRDRKTLETLQRNLDQWRGHCEQAGLNAEYPLPLQVVRDAWLSAIDQPTLLQRFLSGRINFCTLMPMRAIPFRLVCLLGMNDGDFPRSFQSNGFDLMSHRGHYRPGDRSRRQDDQYLFLEALLSAREQLYISWVGRSIRDNSERPPSVLIGHLRDVLAQGWRLADDQPPLLATLTVEHPLQPFSRRYIAPQRDHRLFTYAREWFVDSAAVEAAATASPNATDAAILLNLEALARFLAAPVKAFCRQILQFDFDAAAVTSEDQEPFDFDALQRHQLSQALLDSLRRQPDATTGSVLPQQRATLTEQGRLPLAGFAEAAFDDIAAPASLAWSRYQACLQYWPTVLDAQPITLTVTGTSRTIQLQGELAGLRQAGDGRIGLIRPTAQALLDANGIRIQRLLSDWLNHLTGCAAGLALHSRIVGCDAVIAIAPLEAAEAARHLQTLAAAWQHGMQTPLPLACRTALTWLTAPAEQAEPQARRQYQGDDWHAGEIDRDPYLKRFFPQFDDLLAAEPNFPSWSERLYRPPLQHLYQSESGI